MSIISKEDFTKAIYAIQKSYDCENELNNVLNKYGNDSRIFLNGMCVDTIINLLHAIFGDADKNEWISYFCFELNFGRNFHKGTIICEDGSEADMFTSEDLYNFLINELESNQSSASMD